MKLEQTPLERKPRLLLPAVAKMVNRPFGEKLAETQMLIAKNIHLFNNPAVAWSGGKDSTLVLWLCLKFKSDILTVFNNTGVEYLETIKFIHRLRDEWKINFLETMGVRTFWQTVEEYGMPMPKAGAHHGSNNCCYFLKHAPMLKAIKLFGIQVVFSGMTAAENRNRQFIAKKYGACYRMKQEGYQKVHPILWWTEAEVRQYHADMGIPLNPMYSKGCDRIGCMPCTAFKSWESQLSHTNPKLYALLKLRKDKQYVMQAVFAQRTEEGG